MKDSRFFTRYSGLLLILTFIFTVSCQLDVPIKEMISARDAIKSAKNVDAEKYSPDELKKAEDLIVKSHDLLTEEKDEEAKKSAEDAIAAAVEAEKKALPLYADAHMKAAEDEYAEAGKAYAEKFSPDKFSQAGQLIAESRQHFDSGEYKKSAGLADIAYTLSAEAKNDSMQNSSMIESQIKVLSTRYDKLNKDKFSSSAFDNLCKASVAISAAEKGLENKDFKTSMTEIRNAEIELDAANLIITKKNLYSQIEALRGEMNNVKKGDPADDIKSDLDKALLALNAAETSLEQNYIEDAKMRIKEAESFISGADLKIKEKKALASVKRAEDLLVKAREEDSEKKYDENLNKADGLIENAKTEIKNRKFNDGISSAEEAETVIAAVLNSIESDRNEAKLKAAAEEDQKKAETAVAVIEKKDEEKVPVTEPEVKPEVKIYIVQWRKKNTDCLWRISQKVYNDATFWPAIYIANRDQIKDPDLIFPGQKFIIPPKPKKRPSYKKIVEEEKKALEMKAKEKASEKEAAETK